MKKLYEFVAQYYYPENFHGKPEMVEIPITVVDAHTRDEAFEKAQEKIVEHKGKDNFDGLWVHQVHLYEVEFILEDEWLGEEAELYSMQVYAEDEDEAVAMVEKKHQDDVSFQYVADVHIVAIGGEIL